MLGELERHVDVRRLVHGELGCDLDHVLAEERHPRRAIGLLEMAARRQRRAAIEHADVVEARKPPSNALLPERSLRFTHHVKFSISLWNERSSQSRSPSPRRTFSSEYVKI